MRLYNKQTKQYEDVQLDPPALMAALRAGKYLVPAEQGRVKILAPDNQIGSVPTANLLLAMESGYRLADETDVFAHSAMGQVAAAGAGALSGVALGAGDFLLKNLGVDEKTLQKLGEANPSLRYGTELGVGALAAIGATVGTGGVAGPEVGAVATARAGVLANALRAASAVKTAVTAPIARTASILKHTPTGWVSRLGTNTAEKTAALLLKETASGKPGILATAAGQAGAWGLGGGVEGAAWGVGQMLSEQALGSPEGAGELLASTVWPNVLWGAGISGVLGGAGGLIGSVSERAADRVARGLTKTADKYAGSAGMAVAEEAIYKELGVSGSQLTRMKQNHPDTVLTLFDDTVLPDGAITHIRDPAAPGGARWLSGPEMMPRLVAARKQAGEVISGTWLDVDASLTDQYQAVNTFRIEWNNAETTLKKLIKAGAGAEEIKAAKAAAATALNRYSKTLDASDVPNPIKLAIAMNTKRAEMPVGAAAAKERSIYNKYEDTFLDIARRGVKEGAGGARLPLSFETLRKELKFIDKAYDAVKRADPGTKARMRHMDAYLDLGRTIREHSKTRAARVLGPDGMKPLLRAEATYSNLNDMSRLVERAAAKGTSGEKMRELFGNLGTIMGWRAAAGAGQVLRSVGKMQPALIGSAVGGLVFGGIGGAVGGFAATMAIRHMMPGRPAVAKFAYEAVKLQKLQKMIEAGRARIQKTINKFLKPGPVRAAVAPSVGVLTGVTGDKNPNTALNNLRAELSHLATDPMALAELVQLQATELALTAPEAAMAYVQTVSRAVYATHTAIERIAPLPPPSLQPLLDAKDRTYAPAQLHAIGEFLAGVVNPMGALEELEDGHISNETVLALNQVYPDTMELLRTALRAQVMELKARLLPAQSLALAKLGIVDDAWVLSKPALPPAPSGPAPGGGGQSTRPTQGMLAATRKAPELFATNLQRRERDAGMSHA